MLTERCHVVLVELLGLLVHFDFLLVLKLESLAYQSRHVFGGSLEDDWLKANLLHLHNSLPLLRFAETATDREG